MVARLGSLLGHVLKSVGVAAAIGVLVACSGENPNDVEQANPATSANQEALTKAISVMEHASSYHLSIVPSPPDDDPLRTTGFELDYIAPDLFRLGSHEAEGDTKQVCRATLPTDSTSESCHDILERVAAQNVVEAVWNGDRIWYRQCTGNS